MPPETAKFQPSNSTRRSRSAWKDTKTSCVASCLIRNMTKEAGQIHKPPSYITKSDCYPARVCAINPRTMCWSYGSFPSLSLCSWRTFLSQLSHQQPFVGLVSALGSLVAEHFPVNMDTRQLTLSETRSHEHVSLLYGKYNLETYIINKRNPENKILMLTGTQMCVWRVLEVMFPLY